MHICTANSQNTVHLNAVNVLHFLRQKQINLLNSRYLDVRREQGQVISFRLHGQGTDNGLNGLFQCRHIHGYVIQEK